MHVKKLIEQRNRSKSLKEKTSLCLEIAYHFTEQADHESALSEYKRLLELWQSADDDEQCAIAHRLIADCCIELSDFDQAIKHTHSYLNISVGSGNKLEQQRAYVTLGRCFLNRAEHLKDGTEIGKSLKSASLALLNSIRLITALTSSLDSSQLGEMRAVSLLNLGMLLANAVQSLPEAMPKTAEAHTAAARAHERMGDVYSGIDLHGSALRHYQLMVAHAELACHLMTPSERRDVTTSTTSINQLLDAALVSVAEAHRALTDYDQCVRTYRREIQWVTSTGLATSELANSWFSMAQAMRLSLPSNDADVELQSRVGEDNQTVETFNLALQAAKQSGSVKLIKETLAELEDFYTCHRQLNEASRVQQELLQYNAEDETTDSSQKSSLADDDGTEGEGAMADAPIDEDTVTQYIEMLSSDSELESSLGQGALRDELQDGDARKRTNRKGKALCLKTNMKGETPLHVAAISGDIDHAKKLIEVLGHPVNVTDGAGWSPLHEAAFHGRTEVATFLLDRGARIDDPGCPLDESTPLFEAMHNASLSTALMLVERGANLWHRNKRGECLSELLDLWQPTRRGGSGTFHDQRLLFDRVLIAIRERLGDDYDRWCNQTRSKITAATQSDDSSPESSPPVSSSPRHSTKSVCRQKSHTRDGDRHRSKYPTSPVDSSHKKLVESPSCTRRNAGLRGRGWDDLLIDLDTTIGSESVKHKTNGSTTAIDSYKDAMQAVSGSSNSSRKSSSSKTAPVPRKRPSNIIDLDDENWLINDEQASTRPGSSSKRTRVPLTSRVRDQLESQDVRRPRVDRPPLRERNATADATLSDFHIHKSDVFSSTQIMEEDPLRSDSRKPSIRPTALDNGRPISSSSSGAVEPKSKPRPDPWKLPKEGTALGRGNPASSSSGMSKTKPLVLSTSVLEATEGRERPSPIASSQPTGKYISAQKSSEPFTVKVAFTDISVLIPVDDSSRSVSWLASEACRRRQILRPGHTTIPTCLPSDQVQLSTRDGAVLLPTDRLHTVLTGLTGQGCGGAMIELLADNTGPIASPMDEQSPSTMHTHQRRHMTGKSGDRESGTKIPTEHGLSASTSIPTPRVPPSDPVDRITCSRFFKSLLDRVRSTSCVDLCFLSLGDEQCGLVLHQLLVHGARGIAEVRLKGNNLTLLHSTGTDKSPTNSTISALQRMASHLTLLELDMNSIRLDDLLTLIENSDPTEPRFPRLQRLSLAHNLLDKTDTTNHSPAPLHWITLLERLVRHLPKLSYLNLAGCFTGSSTVSRAADLERICSVSALTELDLGWNLHITTNDLTVLLTLDSMAGLNTLSLRGCCTTRTNQSESSSSLPLSGKQETLANQWLLPSSKPHASAKGCKSNLEVSVGNEIVDTLSSVLSVKGSHSRLQRLDLGHCQLTEKCIPSLHSLFGTPGTSLTTLHLDQNPNLIGFSREGGRRCTAWSDVLRSSAQTASALASLTVDMPPVHEDDDALSDTITAVEAKLLAGLSSTPLQQLVLCGKYPMDWKPSTDSLGDSGRSHHPPLTNAHRLLDALYSLFRGRFGALAKCHAGPDRVMFGVR